jgi:hypothetical protein
VEILENGQILEVSYTPVPMKSVAQGVTSTAEIKLYLQWSEADSVLRKWASLRWTDSPQRDSQKDSSQENSLQKSDLQEGGVSEDRWIKEVVLDKIELQGRPAWASEQEEAASSPSEAQYQHALFSSADAQSHPVFIPGAFLGIEYPVASTRCEAGYIVLAHRPGKTLQPGITYQTRSAVYGMTPIGHEVPSFRNYIAAHRPRPCSLHVNYNSWWTSPMPWYSEGDILGLMKTFDEKLFQARGIALDSFTIDMGWSNAQSVWEIDRQRFPNGFAHLQDATQKMGTRLGLWISPSSYYPPALDGNWAKTQGYETVPLPSFLGLCLGGPKYSEQFKKRLVDLVGGYGMNHLKLDGYSVSCPEASHGHEPGEWSAERVADGMIAAAEAARKANPNVWLETTCFGWNPSPWWLFYVNSVIGTFGDDAPVGRIPSPVYRESYTSARDYFNLQGASRLPIPIAAQEVLGIIHQTPESFLNDAVVTVMRGHQFLPLYVNPKFMDDSRWDALAGLLRWARGNTEILKQTTPLLPVSWQQGRTPRFSDDAAMPREPYGYAHGKQNTGLVLLRNPWIAVSSYALKLDENLGVLPGDEDLSAVSLYPEPRVYGMKLKYGDALEVPLMPYETLVLSINKQVGSLDPKLPSASAVVQTSLHVNRCEASVKRVTFEKNEAALASDETCPFAHVESAVQLACNAEIQVKSPKAELLILCEGDKLPLAPPGRLTVNNQPVEQETLASTAGWSATILPQHEHWLFLRAKLSPGLNTIVLEQYATDCTKISAWVLASRPGKTTASSGVSMANALPEPETIALESVAIIEPREVGKLPPESVRIQRR